MMRPRAGQLPGTSPLEVPEAVVLATAQMAVLAVDLGVRLLVIKGLVSDRMGLRNASDHSDVDVLVERSSLGVVMGALMESGWRPRPRTRVAAFVEYHSRSFIHDSWPIDIDVHVSIPGFLKSPTEVFEALWSTRQSLDVAGVGVTAIGWEAALLLQEVHGLRSGVSAKSIRERSFIRGPVKDGLDDARAARVFQVARDIGADESCAGLLGELGDRSEAPIRSRAEMRMIRGWKAVTNQSVTPADRVVAAILLRGLRWSLIDGAAILLGKGLGAGSVPEHARGRAGARLRHTAQVLRHLFRRGV